MRALMLMLVLACAGSAAAQETIALAGGRLQNGDGTTIDNALILVRGDRIVRVTPGGSVPAGARVIDCAGTIVTPGFVGTEQPVGLVEIDSESSASDGAPEGTSDPIRAGFSAIDGYNPMSAHIPIARMAGVTSVVSTPSGGLVSGTSAWLDLRGPTIADALVDETAALHVNLMDDGVEAGGGARPSAFGRLREAFEDARLFRRSRAAYERRGVRELSVSTLDLTRLASALARELPVVVRVSRSADILRVLALARAYGFRLVLSGAEEGWMVARQIAAANVPVILEPLSDLPTQFSALRSRYDNPALLQRAGVRIAITVAGPYSMRTLRQQAGNAVTHGLAPEAALRAITLEPARIFGVDDRYGTIAAGRVANLVVWTGDPFEVTTWARQVIVRGREVPMRSRQTMLFERYRALNAIARGRTGLSRPPPPRSQ